MPEYEAGKWPVDYALAGDVSRVFQPVDEDTGELSDLQLAAEHVAVNVLWNFTRRVFSTRQVTLRPSRSVRTDQPTTFEGRGPYTGYPAGPAGRAGWLPVMFEGKFYNIRCGVCASPMCSCEAPWALELDGPVAEIVQVMIDDEILNETDYRIEPASNRLILREGSWPLTNNERRDIGEEGTWAITYERGMAVPRSGQLAAGQLAAELGRAAKNQTCALPKRVQSITREGVSMAILDTFEDLEKGRTGLPDVDRWIASVNQPRSAARPPMSVDVR